MRITSQANAEFPCNQGQPPTLSFSTLRTDDTYANVGLVIAGNNISAGAMTNVFANLRNACIGHQSAVQLAHELACSPAAGIVQLCEDLFACGTDRFADGVRLGAASYQGVDAYLTVFARDMNDPTIQCYVDPKVFQPALVKGMNDFPMTTPPCFNVGPSIEDPQQSSPSLAQAGLLFLAGAAAVIGARACVAAYRQRVVPQALELR